MVLKLNPIHENRFVSGITHRQGNGVEELVGSDGDKAPLKRNEPKKNCYDFFKY